MDKSKSGMVYSSKKVEKMLNAREQTAILQSKGMYVFGSVFKSLSAVRSYKTRWKVLEALYIFWSVGKVVQMPTAVAMLANTYWTLYDGKWGLKHSRRGNPNFQKGRTNPYTKKITETSKKHQKARGIIPELSRDNSMQLSPNNLGTPTKFRDLSGDNYRIIPPNSPPELSLLNNKEKSKDKENILLNTSKVAEEAVKKVAPVGQSLTASEGENKNAFKNFSFPTVAEVKAYIAEKGYEDFGEEFVAFYESKGWRVGNSLMRDWKATVRGWEIRRKKLPKSQVAGVAKANAPKAAAQNFDQREYTKEQCDAFYDSLDNIEI